MLNNPFPFFEHFRDSCLARTGIGFLKQEPDETLPFFPQTDFSATFTAIPSFGKRTVAKRFIQELSEGRRRLQCNHCADLPATVAYRHDVSRHLRIEDGHLSKEVGYAMRDSAGSRERRRTVQKNGLATLELKLLKGRNRIPNDLTILRGCPEGQP